MSGMRPWLKVSLRFLMTIPVVFALLFYAISVMNRVPPDAGGDVEYKWVRAPFKARFFPEEHTKARSGDPVLKVSWIGKSQTVHSWLVTGDGIIRDVWHYGFDAGAGQEMPRANADGLARLPDLLKRLPDSDLAANAPNSLIIAYPSAGVWVVRRYRLDAVPKETDDIAKALHVRSSFDGNAIDHW